MIVGIVNEGDSITYQRGSFAYLYGGYDASHTAGTGTGVTRRGFWRFAATGAICVNMAVSGSRLYTNNPVSFPPYGDLTYRASDVDALVAPTKTPLFQTGVADARPTRKYILTIFIGANPDTANATTFTNALSDYCIARKVSGYNKIILGTLLPRGDGILADFETYRNAVNVILKNSSWKATAGVDGIADFGADPIMGNPATLPDTTYYNDQIHPSPTGYAIMQTIYAAAVDAVRATL